MNDTPPGRATRRRPARRDGARMALVAGLLVLAVVTVGVGVGSAAAEDVTATFNATGVGGFVAIDESDTDDPIAFPTPEEVDQPISIEGEVFANGTWQSTDVQFPDLGEEQLGFPVDILLEAPRPFEGDLDRAAGEMTVDAALRIVVPAAEEQIDVAANLTTGESGEMQGEAAGLDTDSATLTLVGNEFTVPEETGDTVIDGFVGLPAPEPGTNWFSLTLAMDIETSTGTVTGTVTSAAGEPVEGATVTTDDRETTTDSDGAYEFEVPVATEAVTVEQFGFADETVSVAVGDGETTTADVELDAVDTGTVAGVVSSTAGEPIEGATVAVDGRETATAADGSYELAAEVGTHDLTVAAGGFTDATRSVTVAANATETADAELEPSVPSFEPVHVFATDATVGGTVEVTAFVQNTGTTDGTENVTVSVGDASVTEGIALGAGQVGTVTLEWEPGAGDEGTHEATVTVANATASADIAVEGPELTVDLVASDAVPGEAVSVVATVTNDGSVAATTAVAVSLTDDGEPVRTASEQVELGPGETADIGLDWDTTTGDRGTYVATAVVDDEEGPAATERVLVNESVGEADFVAESTGGYMAYGYDRLEDALGEGLEFPDKNAGEDPIRIWGVIDEEAGTWESTHTEFPTIEQEGLEGTVEVVDQLRGEIDRESGFLTATATYRVVIEGDEDTSYTFDMTMTTGESGEMTDRGAYEAVNDTFVEIEFVSNDFAVTEQTGDSLADTTLNLPSPEASENYMQLGFEADFDPDEQPDADGQADDRTDGAVDTEPSGTLVATLGQGIGLAGIAVVVLVGIAGLYARVAR